MALFTWSQVDLANGLINEDSPLSSRGVADSMNARSFTSTPHCLSEGYHEHMYQQDKVPTRGIVGDVRGGAALVL